MHISLFYDYGSIFKMSSFFQKYETLFLAVESAMGGSDIRKATGRPGYGFMSFLKAFVYKNAQQIKSVPELIRDLESRPLLCDMIGFPFGKIPDESNFYRFLHEHKNSKFQELLYSTIGSSHEIIVVEKRSKYGGGKPPYPSCRSHGIH